MTKGIGEGPRGIQGAIGEGAAAKPEAQGGPLAAGAAAKRTITISQQQIRARQLLYQKQAGPPSEKLESKPVTLSQQQIRARQLLYQKQSELPSLQEQPITRVRVAKPRLVLGTDVTGKSVGAKEVGYLAPREKFEKRRELLRQLEFFGTPEGVQRLNITIGARLPESQIERLKGMGEQYEAMEALTTRLNALTPKIRGTDQNTLNKLQGMEEDCYKLLADYTEQGSHINVGQKMEEFKAKLNALETTFSFLQM